MYLSFNKYTAMTSFLKRIIVFSIGYEVSQASYPLIHARS